MAKVGKRLSAARTSVVAEKLYTLEEAMQMRIEDKLGRGQKRVGQRPGGGRRPRWKGPAAKQVVVMRGSRRVAGKATSAQQGLLHLGKRGMIFVGEVKDEGDEDDPQCEIRSQAGHPVPVGHESRRRLIWEPGKLHSELRKKKELEPVGNFSRRIPCRFSRHMLGRPLKLGM